MNRVMALVTNPRLRIIMHLWLYYVERVAGIRCLGKAKAADVPIARALKLGSSILIIKSQSACKFYSVIVNYNSLSRFIVSLPAIREIRKEL